MSENTKTEAQYLTTGCTLLDLCVGGGVGMGFPAGVMVNFVGDKSSGKTFIATEMIAANYHRNEKKFKWNYDDSESGFTFNTDSLYGFDVMHPETLQSETIEQMDAHVGMFLKSLKPTQTGIYVVDSLDGLSNDDKQERAAERIKAEESEKEVKKKGTYDMGTPKFLSQEFFKTRISQVRDKNALLVIVSQVRENLEPFSFKKYVRSGGKALDFYAHTVVWLSNVCKIEKNGKIIGVVVKAKTEKSKTPRPFRDCTFSIYFDYGVDNIGSSLDYLFDLRTDKGKLIDNKKICWGEGSLAQTMENVNAWLKEIDLYDKLKEIKKEETGRANLSVEWVKEHVEKDTKLTELFNNKFGEPLERQALIELIEQSPELQKELEQRVIAKWEAEETAIATNRKKKYV